ncbi:cell division protein FtsQ/DivIB [Salimicrobium flavidum]|uniref:Cell division protein DivIB n=1 Tax=Salimicrobium flavidum TaxID=570947 RepID=A0A1N7ILI5_9BACI|nr:FtsQ-type POTRA domain-containing protein [Salimicrobium flavidum]SIS37922.1 cell division protein FtsQ [Salimicrobium flavidum]
MKKEKNVVSIEERIPQLKKRRKRKVNRQLILYLTILFLLIGIVIYLQTPLSHVRNIEVSGNAEVTKEEIVELSGITENSSLWGIDRSNVSDKLTTHPEIKNAEVGRNFPANVTISVDERERIAYVKNGESYAPILENGTILDELVENPGGDAPIFFGFPDKEHLKELTSELSDLPSSVSSLISEVHWVEEEEWDKVRLYMSDGHTVLASVRHFSEKMPSYPSIVAQLNPETEGIIHIGVGTYFESFSSEEDEEEEESEESDVEDPAAETEEENPEETVEG